MIDCATTLLLAPGVVQIFYGDESGRGLSDARYNVDSNQAFRSDMNWESIDTELLAHFQKLGRIRRDNPVIAKGRQTTLDVHTCLREADGERLMIRLRPDSGRPIESLGVFADGDTIVDLYSGQQAVATRGRLDFSRPLNSVAILKKL